EEIDAFRKAKRTRGANALRRLQVAGFEDQFEGDAGNTNLANRSDKALRGKAFVRCIEATWQYQVDLVGTGGDRTPGLARGAFAVRRAVRKIDYRGDTYATAAQSACGRADVLRVNAHRRRNAMCRLRRRTQGLDLLWRVVLAEAGQIQQRQQAQR